MCEGCKAISKYLDEDLMICLGKIREPEGLRIFRLCLKDDENEFSLNLAPGAVSGLLYTLMVGVIERFNALMSFIMSMEG